MVNPEQHSIPADASSRNEMIHSGRFEKFTDAELSMLSEGLSELLQLKTKAMEILNFDLGSNPKDPFTEADFGIPEIRAMLSELEELL
jgi:hypothetical protein